MKALGLVAMVLVLVCTGCAVTDRLGGSRRRDEALQEVGRLEVAGDYGAAAVILQRLRDDSPRDARILARLGRDLIAAGQEDKAFLPLTEAAEAGDAGREAWVPLGRLLRRRKDFDKAREFLEKAVAQPGTERGAALTELGIVHWRSDRLAAAEAALRDAVAGAPENQSAWFHYAQVLVAKRDIDGATRAIDKAVTLQPDDIYARFTRAELRFEKAADDGAREDYRAVVARNVPFPRLGRVFHQLGALDLRASRWREALGAFDLAARHGCDLTAVSIGRARALLGLGDAKGVMEQLGAPAVAETHQAVYLRGRALSKLGRHSEAVKLLTRARAMPLNQALVETALGTALLAWLDSGDPSPDLLPRARAAFALGLKQDAREIEALYGMARIHAVHEGDLALATARLEVLLGLVPKHREALALRASVRACRGQLEDALADLDSVSERPPLVPQLMFLRGAILLDRLKHRDAETSVVAGLKGDSRDLFGRMVLVSIHARTGRRDAALAELADLLPIDRDSRLVRGWELVYEGISRVLSPLATPQNRDPDLERPFAAAQKQLELLGRTAGPEAVIQSVEVVRTLVEHLCFLELSGALADAHRERFRTRLAETIKGLKGK